MTCSTVVIIAYFANNYGFFGYLTASLIYPTIHNVAKKFDKTHIYDEFHLKSELPKKKNSHKEYSKYLPKERVITFSDGIFAIAITLTVVNLRSPEIDENSGNDSDATVQFNQALIDMWPQFVSFIFSFAIMGIFWFWHHKIFSVVEKVSMGLYRLNIIFLLTLGTIPGLITFVSFTIFSLHFTCSYL